MIVRTKVLKILLANYGRERTHQCLIRQIFNMENILVMNLCEKRIDKNKLECSGPRLGLSDVLELGRFGRGNNFGPLPVTRRILISRL